MIVNGRLQLDIFKNIGGRKVRIGGFDDDNKITLSGKQVMAFLITGEPGNHVISKFGVGEGTSFPDDYDTGLTNGFIRELVGYRFLEDTVVQWDFRIDADEAVGLNVGEFALYSADEQLFARKIRTPVIAKDSSMILSGQWTVWLIECRKTTFSSYVTLDFVISSPATDFINEITITPVIAHSIISDANAERVIASQADIVFDATSNPNSAQLFTSTAGIVSSISAPIVTFTNVERRFISTIDLFVETSYPAIGSVGRFENLFADIISEIRSDIKSDAIDFSDGFTEVDPLSDLVIDSASQITYSTMQRLAVAGIYKDMGADYADADFEFQFTMNWTDQIGSDNQIVIFALSEAFFLTEQDRIDGDDGLSVSMYHGTGLILADEKGDVTDTFALTGDPTVLRYMTLERVGLDVTLYVYTDSDRQTLAGTAEITQPSAYNYRWLYPITSMDSTFNGGSDQSGTLTNYAKLI
jgi:hypothetical protein